MTNEINVALPNTYIHPVRGGTGCFKIGPSTFDASVRSSNHSHIVFRNCMGGSGYRSRRGQNFHTPVRHANGVLRERLRRSPGRHRPVLVIHAPTKRTHEEFGLLQPSNRTSEMSAIDGKRNELPIGLAAKPVSGLSC